MNARNLRFCVAQWSEAPVAISRSKPMVVGSSPGVSDFSLGNCSIPDTHFRNGFVISSPLKTMNANYPVSVIK